MPFVDMIETGKNIKNMCKAKGIAVDDITKKTGISKVAVYKWFNGNAIPSIDNIVILAAMFHAKIDDIIITRIA